jgi:hypothetical protein
VRLLVKVIIEAKYQVQSLILNVCHAMVSINATQELHLYSAGGIAHFVI